MGSSGAMSIGGATCLSRSAGLRLSTLTLVLRTGQIRFMLCSSVAILSASLTRFPSHVFSPEHTRTPFRKRYRNRYGMNVVEGHRGVSRIVLFCVTNETQDWTQALVRGKLTHTRNDAALSRICC